MVYAAIQKSPNTVFAPYSPYVTANAQSCPLVYKGLHYQVQGQTEGLIVRESDTVAQLNPPAANNDV